MNRVFLTTCLLAAAGLLPAAEPPSASITNGQIRADLYLPDAGNGFYRGTRFDHSGIVSKLEYKGHNYFGIWFNSVDEKIRDFIYSGQNIVASTCTAITGPVEDFGELGWDAAAPGGTFVKIGVGTLRKEGQSFDKFKLYKLVDPGKWTVQKRADSVEFIHELSDPSTGYGYIYRKTVRLVEGKPEMVLEHSLRNTGRRAIENNVYNHNFFTFDKQAPGPDLTITLPFQLRSSVPPEKQIAEIKSNRIQMLKTLEGKERIYAVIEGYGSSPSDNEIRIDNRKSGAGVRVTGDRPLSNLAFWGIRTVLAAEPFIAISVKPGSEFTWKNSYEFYVK
jgi:hypothetical protein